jgi:hypothetical protein
LNVTAEAAATLFEAAADLRLYVRHHFLESRPEGVIAPFGDHIRAGRDQMDTDAKGRAFLVPTFQPDIRLINLQAGLQSENTILNERVQFVAGAQVVMLHGQSHDLICGLRVAFWVFTRDCGR